MPAMVGLIESQIAASKAAASKHCVISAVDKSKADIAFSCPRFHKWRMLKMHIDGNTVNIAYDGDKVIISFRDMKENISYSGLPMPLNSHHVGAADIIPKN